MEGVVIPIVAIVVSVGGPVAIAIVVLAQRHRQKQKRYEMILRATEAGRSPDEIEELLGAVNGGSPRNGLLKAGCIVAAMGLGIFLIGVLNDAARMSLGGGAFVFVLGLGMVAAWYFGDRREGRSSG